MNIMCVQVHPEVRERIAYSGTGVSGQIKLVKLMVWLLKPNLGSLQGQQMFLTAGPFLQPLMFLNVTMTFQIIINKSILFENNFHNIS